MTDPSARVGVEPLRQHRERAIPEGAPSVLERGLVAHVSWIEGSAPVTIPMAYQYDSRAPTRLFLHGAVGARITERTASRALICVSVTLVHDLVYSRTALYHTMNYESIVCWGRGHLVDDAELAQRVLDAMVARYYPGRTPGRDYEPTPPSHLVATGVVELAIERWSAKRREGAPKGPRDADPAAPGTAGLVPVRSWQV